MEKGSSSLEKNPELVIGLVGAVGTDLSLVVDVISEVLETVSYSYEEIRFSSLIRDIGRYSNLKEFFEETEDVRIDAHMEACDDLRRRCGRGDILALLATQKIRAIRSNISEASRPLERFAYILNSLKHPDEIKRLRDIYGSSFILVSVYSPKNLRLDVLAKKIAHKHFEGTDTAPYRSIAETLILKDAKSQVDEYGQNVNDAFPLADIFIRMESRSEIFNRLKRAFYLWFQHPFITPTIDEYGIFSARASSLRSSDLSRQVGAIITSKSGDILTSGFNEVPKPGGGVFVDDDGSDSNLDDREFRVGKDTTVSVKEELIGEIVKRLYENKWLSKKSKSISNLVEELLYGSSAEVLKGTRVSSIIEFGRIIHAEMAAITDAARRGVSIQGATLYCTTYPCHMCARHIIASGIDRVVFIEPYPKSMAKDLYQKSLIVDGDVNHINEASNAVRFESFVGVAPRRYMEFFSMPRRKNENGVAVTWNPRNSSPRIVQNFQAYTETEAGWGAWIDSSKELIGIECARKDVWRYKKGG
jgi:Deoxycytidylate deaminase